MGFKEGIIGLMNPKADDEAGIALLKPNDIGLFICVVIAAIIGFGLPAIADMAEEFIVIIGLFICAVILCWAASSSH